ncbi:MAG: alanine dehydrogenase [Chlamydiae bacterium]|nr:alanine dehydrogenase [Chlamydiota bacterium]
MLIGIPKEVKNHEYRVGATPAIVEALVRAGHSVLVQKEAGAKLGFPDEQYKAAGAKIVTSLKEVYQAEMIIKVKEPQPEEYPLLKREQILFCYLHLAPDPEQTKALLKQEVVGIAYETIYDEKYRLPLLTPMSEIAGRISIQAGAVTLQLSHGGRGVLLGGVPGVAPGYVVIIGGGVVGTEAAKMAVGLGARTTVLDTNLYRLRELDVAFQGRLQTLYSSACNLEEEVKKADLVVGAVLIPGKTAPRLVTRKMLKTMKRGSVIVDVAIDQGGCIETSRPTTHSEPTFEEEGVIHYCVTNMPGACALTATLALTNATFPYMMKLANLGYKKALRGDPLFTEGLNVCLGHVTHRGVAHDLKYPFKDPAELLG